MTTTTVIQGIKTTPKNLDEEKLNLGHRKVNFRKKLMKLGYIDREKECTRARGLAIFQD